MTEHDVLNCRELVELMSDYLEGCLSPEDSAHFRRHLDECPACEVYLRQFALTIRLTGKVTAETLTDHQKDTLLQAFRDWKLRRG